MSRRVATGVALLGLALLAFVLAAGDTGTPAHGASSGGGSSCAAGADTLALGSPACRARVTPDGGPYGYTALSARSVTVTAPVSSGANNREFVWSSTSPVESDASACATFEYGKAQAGIALRISSPSGTTSTTGITVVQNFAFYVRNVFEIDAWDTSKPLPFTLFEQTTIPALPLHPATFPLHMCARIVGNTVQFVVWKTGMAQPSWGDPAWGGQAELPPGTPPRGQSGFYAGHVQPGTSVTLSALTVDGRKGAVVP